MAKADAEEARKETRKISNAFQILQEEQKRRSAEWKPIQTRLTADVESMAAENNRLQQEVGRLTAEATKLHEERDGDVRRALQFQEELGPLKLELTVSHKDVRQARIVNRELQNNVERLHKELGKKVYLAQANLRKLVDKFREKTKAEIEIATAIALQGWFEQAAELQVLRADKANRELRGPGFWKLDKANYEAVQKNLTTDSMRIALTHREEITKLLE
jgi:hypothetical protein